MMNPLKRPLFWVLMALVLGLAVFAAPIEAVQLYKLPQAKAAVSTEHVHTSTFGTVRPTPLAVTVTSTSTKQMYVTGYSFWDNTPPGSAEISHPVIHNKAGGTGTYDNPVTVAVGHSIIDGKDKLDFKKGTRFYIPNLRKYFIVEDTCGDGHKPQNGPCHRLDTPGNRAPAGAQAWIDVWVGGKKSTDNQANDCMEKLTRVQKVLIKPEPGYKVVKGEISSGSTCRAGYGDKLVKA